MRPGSWLIWKTPGTARSRGSKPGSKRPKPLGDGLLAVEIRDALTEHLRGDRLAALDRDLVRWLVEEIKRKLRSGPIKPEVATLASRVADSFADTPEGAAAQRIDPQPPPLRRPLPPLRPPSPEGRPTPARAAWGSTPPGTNPTYVPLSGETDFEESP